MITPTIDNRYHIHIIAPQKRNYNELLSMLKEIPLNFQITESNKGRMDPQDNDVDIYIVWLPPQNKAASFLDESAETVFKKSTLIISDGSHSRIRLWDFRHGACVFLAKPFTLAELHVHIERLLHGRLSEKIVLEKYMITFLKDMHKHSATSIKPSLDAKSPYAHYYPEVVQTFGKTYKDLDFLESLANINLVHRNIYSRVRLCPVCNDSRANYAEVCPKCQSTDIVETDIIQHFSCGHIDTESAFTIFPDLVCPKCNKTLSRKGLDYEKPSLHYKCNACNFMFADTKIQFQCVLCRHTCEPSDAIEKPIYSYDVTPLASEVVKSGRIIGINLTDLLYKEFTSLYSKQYFEMEIKRELLRTKRYGHYFSLLLIRLDNLNKIEANQPSKLEYYANNVFKTLSKDLRKLDTTCVWDDNIIAVLLTETDRKKAENVAKRIRQNIKDQEYLYTIKDTEFSISLVEGNSKLQSSDDMIALAKTNLKNTNKVSAGLIDGEEKLQFPDEIIRTANAELEGSAGSSASVIEGDTTIQYPNKKIEQERGEEIHRYWN